MRNVTRKLTLVATTFVFGASAQAAMSPVGISIFAPVQFPGEETSVTGFRANILYGEHRKVYGFDVGVGINRTTQSFGGVVQAAGLSNINNAGATAVGAQVAGIANLNGAGTTVVGVQASLYNSNEGAATLVGFGLGLVNRSPFMTVAGGQVGIYNSAGDVYGVQVGLVNVAERLHGLQIGLVNIHRQGLFKICPIINFGF